MKDKDGKLIICGKCGSYNIYRETWGDTASVLACLMCGNRSGSEYGFKTRDGAAHPERERKVIGPYYPSARLLPRSPELPKKEEKMGVARIKGTCSNCLRPDLMVNSSSRRCGTCETAIKGVWDPEKRKELLAAKAAALQSGKRSPRKPHSKDRQPDKTTAGIDYVPTGKTVAPGGGPPHGLPIPGITVSVTIPLHIIFRPDSNIRIEIR